MRKRWLAVLGVCIALPATAHDFWIQPSSFWVAPGARTPVSLLVGHGASPELWDADISRVSNLQSTGPEGVTPQRGSIQQGGRGSMSFATPGVHVVSLQTSQAPSNLPAARFNEYLKEEGLTPAIEHRERAGQTNAVGRELFSRRAKALVRVGSGPVTVSPQVTTPIGLTLEIVPDLNPYGVTENQSLPFRVLYKGKPLAGALVRLHDLAAGEDPAATMISNESGRVAFRVPRRGNWQLNVVWTEPLPGNPTADFDTVFSSLTFGYGARPNG